MTITKLHLFSQSSDAGVPSGQETQSESQFLQQVIDPGDTYADLCRDTNAQISVESIRIHCYNIIK